MRTDFIGGYVLQVDMFDRSTCSMSEYVLLKHMI